MLRGSDSGSSKVAPIISSFMRYNTRSCPIFLFATLYSLNINLQEHYETAKLNSGERSAMPRYEAQLPEYIILHITRKDCSLIYGISSASPPGGVKKRMQAKNGGIGH